MQALHQLKFPHLDAAGFEYLQNRCAALGVNPESELVFASIIVSPHTNQPEVFVGLKMDGFRQRAHATGQLARIGVARYDFPPAEGSRADGKSGPSSRRVVHDDDDVEPSCRPQVPNVARVMVIRDRNGRRDRFVGEAWWDEYYADQPPGSVAMRLPKASLRSRAEVAALRAGFADILGGLYSDDELEQMARASVRTRMDRGRLSPPHDHDDSADQDTQAAPRPPKLAAGGMSFHTLCRELAELGIDEDQSPALMAEQRRKHPGLADASADLFYRKILATARKQAVPA